VKYLVYPNNWQITAWTFSRPYWRSLLCYSVASVVVCRV